MIETKVKFYYGHTVDKNNQYIDFKEGAGPELTTTVDVGEYSLTDFLDKVATALNAIGANTYTVTVNRTTRIITISSTGSFTLLASTGSNFGFGLWTLLGFSSDTGSATSHVATSASGSVWIPQYLPQDNIEFDNNQLPIDGSVKQSTDGTVEAVKFGTRKIMEANFKFITDHSQVQSSPIDNDNSGLFNARTFMEYAVTKADLEFMPDRDDPDVFHKCILESTPEDSNGLGFKLKELFSQGLVGYYETGILKFREL